MAENKMDGGIAMALHYSKLKAAIYYICDLAKDSDALDPIKLNKVLWYSDTAAYLKTGQSITGERYIRKPFGPVAKRNQNAVDELVEAGFVMPGKAEADGYWHVRLDVTEDMSESESELSKGDKSILATVYKDVVKGNSSFGISEKSHGDVWELARDGEDIPLYTVFAEQLAPVTAADMREARQGLA